VRVFGCQRQKDEVRTKFAPPLSRIGVDNSRRVAASVVARELCSIVGTSTVTLPESRSNLFSFTIHDGNRREQEERFFPNKPVLLHGF
jgi:hypothetical protein